MPMMWPPTVLVLPAKNLPKHPDFIQKILRALGKVAFVKVPLLNYPLESRLIDRR